MRNRKPAILFFLIIFLGLLFTAGCHVTPSAVPISRTDFAFDTVITITVYDKEDANALTDCFSLAEHYETLFSRTLEGSDVSRINSAGGAPVQVDPETIDLLESALSYARLSGGVFDPTIGAVSSLWDFSSGKGEVPAASDIEEAVRTVDYTEVTVDRENCLVQLLNKDARIDLGGIAKGYIADRMKDTLLSHGVENAIINLGGNVLVIGNKPDGSAYHIGIQKPFAGEGTPLAELPLSDMSLVSSGVYERYFEKDGELYHHILDTKTGYPVRNNLLGVTIRSRKSVDGDALSTICFALGLENGLSLIESIPDTEAVFITDDYVLHPSSGLADAF